MADLPWIGSVEKVARMRADDPTAEVWRYLQLFGDASFLNQHWNGASNASVTAVVTTIRQAYEYHLAAQAASLVTRPLFLYYSCLNLTKALLYFKSNRPPSAYHGLSRPQLTGDFLSLGASTNNGVFLELAEFVGAPLSRDRGINLEQLILSTPELIRRYSLYFSKPSEVVQVEVAAYHSGRLEVRFVDIPREDLDVPKLRALIKERTLLLERFTEEEEAGKFLLTTKVPNAQIVAHASPLLTQFFVSTVYPESPRFLDLRPADERVHAAPAYLGLGYVLSSLVRSAPNELDSIINGREASARWFFKEVCDQTARVFPNLIVNLVFEDRFIFAPSFG